MQIDDGNCKKVLVTGASGGIGRAVAVAAAKEGYYVIAHYGRSLDRAEETMTLIKSAGGQGELVQFDVCDRDACRQALDKMTEKQNQDEDPGSVFFSEYLLSVDHKYRYPQTDPQSSYTSLRRIRFSKPPRFSAFSARTSSRSSTV